MTPEDLRAKLIRNFNDAALETCRSNICRSQSTPKPRSVNIPTPTSTWPTRGPWVRCSTADVCTECNTIWITGTAKPRFIFCETHRPATLDLVCQGTKPVAAGHKK